MFGLSLRTFRERWQLFIGAIVTVCLGVSLVQSSLLILVSAASPHLPAGLSPLAAEQLSESYEAAITLLAMILGLGAFLAVFIVSSTFAFTVAQRRKDLALLRLVGAGRGQLRRLLLAEALLLGVIGTALGVPLGRLVMRLQTWMLIDLKFLPSSFEPRWQSWIFGVSAGVGIGVALLGVLAASRRAAKVRPLEALRDTGAAVRVMTAPRWFFGAFFLAGAVAMAILAQFTSADGAVPLSMFTSIAAAIALSALSPLVVPLFGRLFGLLLRRSPLGELAQANLRDGVRRSASTAAPLLVLVALLLGMSSSINSVTAAGDGQQARSISGDLIVDSSGASAARIGAVPGVAVAAEQVNLPFQVTTITQKKHKTKVKVHDRSALAIDSNAYQRTHPLSPTSGSLADLHGLTVALGPGNDNDDGLSVGSMVDADIGGHSYSLRVVAVLPEFVNGGADFLVPQDILPAAALAGADVQTVVQVDSGVDPSAVATRIQAARLGSVSTVARSLASRTDSNKQVNSGILVVLMGLAGLYTLVAVINAVVISAAERKAEFAAARVTGLSRGQVVRMALIESWAVTAIGLVLGCVAATATLLGIGAATGRMTGVSVIEVPWDLLGAVVIGAFAVIGTTSVWTSVSATRATPVSWE
ncbi:MAG TPA: FtsX-like permease family protein [Pseudonocardiaceae bacterium]|jgi:putative ABC transport system permease protein|nr:FtsX-like permease family protein [Pseudonocardiaceae bacterium]